MKTLMKTVVALAAAGIFGLSPAGEARATTIELTEDGIHLTAGPDAKYTLGYPQPVTAAKKNLAITGRQVDGRKATLTFEGGGRAEVALGDGEIALSFTDVPTGTKMVYTTIRIPTDSGIGVKWSIGGTASGELPKDKPAKPFLFQGNANSLELTSPSGAKLALQLPDHTYHQLQDNREWGAGIFQWQCWPAYYPDAANPRIVIRVGDSAAAAARPQKVAAPRAAPNLEADPGPETGATKILKWKDGKQAVFMLEFDDSCESHIRNVVPELKKRGMVGTFYINPGNGPFKNKRSAWENDVPAAGMVLANHTFTHSHALDVADFENELTLCNDVIHKCYPGRKQPRLISYGPPGGIPKEKWLVTKDEVNASLAKLHLIERPSFFGPPIHQKSGADVLKVLDQALAKGDMGYLVFHGVGGDWLVTPMEWFLPLLDKLEANRDLVWITDPISWHQYVTERKSAEVKLLAAEAKQIRLQLACSADPALYDLPLTLATRVPSDWKSCSVKQGTSKTIGTPSGGVVRYEAVPGSAEIVLQSAP